jgi:MFS family permease
MRLSQSSRVGGAGLLALVATYGIGRQAYGLFVPTFREEFGLSLDVLGFYASAAQAGYLVATVVTGVLTARFGPRVPVVSGCLLLAVGAAMTASAPGPLLLAVGIIAAGTSAGGTWGPFSDAVDLQVPVRQPACVGAGQRRLPGRAGGRQRARAGGRGPVAGRVVGVRDDRAGGGRGVLEGAGAERGGAGLGPCTAPARVVLQPPVGAAARRHAGGLDHLGCLLRVRTRHGTGRRVGRWIGPAMWAALGIAGAAVGVFGGGIADRYGLRGPLAVMLVLVGGSTVVLLVAPGSVLAALGSAALFGVGFTTGFALVVMWSQQVFHDRPTTGFTLAIVFSAAGFIVGPSLFGVLATHVGRPSRSSPRPPLPCWSRWCHRRATTARRRLWGWCSTAGRSTGSRRFGLA